MLAHIGGQFNGPGDSRRLAYPQSLEEAPQAFGFQAKPLDGSFQGFDASSLQYGL